MITAVIIPIMKCAIFSFQDSLFDFSFHQFDFDSLSHDFLQTDPILISMNYLNL